MTIIVYARPWNKEQFFELAEKIWPGQELVLSSEHSSVDQSGLYESFYQAIKEGEKKKHNSNLTETQVEDIIIRCRLLRGIDKKLAEKLVFSMEQAIERMLKEHSPKYILSITVDSYVLHLLSFLCKRRGVQFIGLIPTFLKNTFRITVLGERHVMRTVTDEECKLVLADLTKYDYKPSFVSLNRRVQRKKAVKLWRNNVVKPVWFCLKRFLSKDIYNYHYYQAQLISKKYWSFLPRSPMGVKIRSVADISDYSDSRQVLFLPLQMSPEATIDYWSADTSWIEYESKVLNLIESLGQRYDILIKEHPNVVGYRKPSFYKELKKYQEKGLCRQIDPYLNSNLILDVVDGVLLCTGSIGFEAFIRGIPVYSDSKPFYLSSQRFYTISQLTHGSIPAKNMPTEDQSIDLIRKLLESTAHGNFVNDGTWGVTKLDQSDVASGISKYIKLI